MKHFLFLLPLTLIMVSARAQPLAHRESTPSPAALEQRRAQLRLALTAPPPRTSQAREERAENGPVSRRLSDRERADLRQQLLEQRRNAGFDAP